MAQAFYPTNDGHIGNLQNLSDIELTDLIQRHEKLMKKRSFLTHLPDKGEKIKEKYDKINQEHLRRKELHKSAQQVSVNPRLTDMEVTDPDSLDARLQELNIDEHKESVKSSGSTKHQYEVAMEKAQQNSKAGRKEPFKLNRKLKIEKVCDLPEEIKKTKENIPPVVRKAHKSKNTVMEESAVVPPCYKYNTAHQIDIHESLELLKSQRQKQEELQAQLAAEKLAQKLNIKMETYNPEGVDMSYRNRGDLDSDDDDNDETGHVISSDSESEHT